MGGECDFEHWATEVVILEGIDDRCGPHRSRQPGAGELWAQETRDFAELEEYEAYFPVTALCRRIDLAFGMGCELPTIPASGMPLIGGWTPPHSPAVTDMACAEQAADVLLRFADSWPAPALTAQGLADKRAAFLKMMPELWAALATVGLRCTGERCAEVTRALVLMRHPAPPPPGGHELWLRRRAAVLWCKAVGSSRPLREHETELGEDLGDYVAFRRAGP